MPRVGYIAIVGRPNTGKSTFLNALIGERVSAISPRPQTTQRSIPGIFTDTDTEVQMIFLDTPGIHRDAGEQFGSQKSHEIHHRINGEALASLKQADVILRLLDPTRPYGVEDQWIDEQISYSSCPIIRVETKQDLKKHYPQKNVSAHINSLTKEGFPELIEQITELLPEGPFLYDEEYYTDQSMDLRIAEVIRESLFHELGDEIPYACFVEIAEIESDDITQKMKIQAYINVETESQKTIVIGKAGSKIAAIGSRSRLILEDIFQKSVFLAVRVKVMKNWRKNERILDRVFPKK